MAKATQTTTRKRVSVKVKPKVPEGKMKCNVCNGTGYQKKPTRKKKK